MTGFVHGQTEFHWNWLSSFWDNLLTNKEDKKIKKPIIGSDWKKKMEIWWNLSLGFTWIGDTDCPKPQCVVCSEVLVNNCLKPSYLPEHEACRCQKRLTFFHVLGLPKKRATGFLCCQNSKKEVPSHIPEDVCLPVARRNLQFNWHLYEDEGPMESTGLNIPYNAPLRDQFGSRLSPRRLTSENKQRETLT